MDYEEAETRPSFYVEDLATARALRLKRLLTSSIRLEPSFKHDLNRDDPDQEPDLNTKKGRKVAGFSFEKLLPLELTTEEARLALDLGLVVLEQVGDENSTFLVRLYQDDGKQQQDWPFKDQPLSSKDLVFRDLWKRGFCMVDGLKFGVDYLAYGNDPLRFHADLMVLIVDPYSSYGSNLWATSACAVAGKSKKVLVLASVSEDNLIIYTRMSREAVFVPQKEKTAAPKTRDNDDDDENFEDALVDY